MMFLDEMVTQVFIILSCSIYISKYVFSFFGWICDGTSDVFWGLTENQSYTLLYRKLLQSWGVHSSLLRSLQLVCMTMIGILKFVIDSTSSTHTMKMSLFFFSFFGCNPVHNPNNSTFDQLASYKKKKTTWIKTKSSFTIHNIQKRTDQLRYSSSL